MALLEVDAEFVTVILEDCLVRLQIIGKVISQSTESLITASTGTPTPLPEESFDMGSEGESRNEASDNSSLAPPSILLKKKSGNVLTLTEKLEMDRGYIEKVISNALHEVQQTRTYMSLIEAINCQKQKREGHHNVTKEAKDQKHAVNKLKKEVEEAKDKMELKLEQMDNHIIQLKDQLHKSKARTEMEIDYVRQRTHNDVTQVKKRCYVKESTLRRQLERLRNETDYEDRANAEIESFLREHLQDLEKKLEYWKKKYDEDIKNKDGELDTLQNAKAANLKKIKELSLRLEVYETVIEEDRLEKKIAQEKREQDEKEQNAATKIQAWWRGTMVRKCLGPYSKKKKGGKKGKKGKKKK